MQSIGTLAHHAETPWQQDEPEAPTVERSIVNLFLVLQGTYGTLFLSKYSSGVKDKKGHDLGMRATMRVWDSALAKYTPDVVERAVSRLTTEFPEFPPNLTQFEAICRAAEPRKSHAELQGWTALPAPTIERIEVGIEPVGDGKDQFRKIWARHLAGDKTLSPFSVRAAIEVLGTEAAAMKQEAQQ